MVKKSSMMLVLIVAAALIAVPFGSVLAQDNSYDENPWGKDRNAGAMAADMLLARPVGICSIVVGFGLFVASVPFSAMGGNTGQAWEKMVVEPTTYTFHRPLGEF